MEKEYRDSSTAEKCGDSTKCTVCRKSFCEPKLLPCGHLMCRKCLLSSLEKTRRATCPNCHYPILKDSQTAPPASQCKEDVSKSWCHGSSAVEDKNLQELVKGFPTELWTAALVKAERLLREKHECQACGEEATSYCHQCGDTLCGSCKNLHVKFTATRHHVVEELSGLTAERLANFSPLTPCPQHPDEPYRLFCLHHDTSLCLLECTTSCPKVTPFGRRVENAKVKLMQLNKVMTDSSAAMDGALRELDQHLADMERRENPALFAIQTLKERLCKAVEDRCQRLELQFKQALEDVREAVREAKTVLLGRQSRLDSHIALTQRILTSRARDVVCGMTSVMEARVRELDHQVKLPETAKVITTVKGVLKGKAVLEVEKHIARLGEVKIDFAPLTANAGDAFDHNHGQRIVLSNNGKTAARTHGNGYSTVVVRKPLAVGDLVEFQMDLWDKTCFTEEPVSPILGVITLSPYTISLKDEQWAFRMDSTAIVSFDNNFIAEKEQPNSMMRKLRNIKQGSCVGVALDRIHHLHLYVDGDDQGVFAQNLTMPCYALFDVCDYVKQVTLLPRRCLSW